MDDKTAFEERILPAIRNMGERFADVIARENKRQAAEETSFSQAMRAYFSDPAHKGFRNEFKQDLMGQGLMQRQDAMLERKEAVNALNDAYDIFTRCKWEFQSGNAESHDMLVIDSVAALVPKAELEGEMGDSHMGLQARLMSQALRKLTGSISKSNTTIIFINQIRMKIGVMFGNPETTTGGNALKFYASVRLDIRRTGAIKEKDEVIGSTTKVKVVKNKVAPPFRVVEFDIMYGEGISKTGELLDLGVKAGIVEKSGSFFSFNNIRLGQGKENSKNFLKENPKIAAEIEQKIRDNAAGVTNAMQGTAAEMEDEAA